MQPDTKETNAARAATRFPVIIRFTFVSPARRPGIPPLLPRSAEQVNESTLADEAIEIVSNGVAAICALSK
jgi:hypothetical protein